MVIPPVVILDKKRGQTPLQLLTEWKDSHPELRAVQASYAGRLDPMAEGKLLVLLGNECRNQNAYTKLDKEYVVEVLLDLKTDTGDVLGLPTYEEKQTAPPRTDVVHILQKELGPHSRKYPVFSSKTVRGKPLFVYALEGALSEIVIPEHIETLYKVDLMNMRTVSSRSLQSLISTALQDVPRSDEPSKKLGADFRQDAIRAAWTQLFDDMPKRTFTILTLRIVCGSGSYMRPLAQRVGESLGTSALALSITRTEIGKYQKIGFFGFWTKRY